jgi:hypothetical protein
MEKKSIMVYYLKREYIAIDITIKQTIVENITVKIISSYGVIL